MFRLARRNLLQDKARLLISLGGVALALLLILALDAIFAGAQVQLSAYIDYSGADIYIAQSGVKNMHMTASALSPTVAPAVGQIPGVATVTPILYASNVIVAGDTRSLAYIIGLDSNAAVGGPWKLAAGIARPQSGQAIIDRSVAREAAMVLGDTVEILGHTYRIVGLSEGTVNLTNSVAFIPRADFARSFASQDNTSYLLVTVKPGARADDVAAAIRAEVPNVSVMTRQQFSAEERRVVKDMSVELISIMNSVGFLIGLAVTALTVYTATFAKRKEFGVLKALGAGNRWLYGVVVASAFLSVGGGFVLAVLVVIGLAVLVPQVSSTLLLAVTWQSLLKVAVASLIIASVAAVLPVRQIAGLDPASVFRR